jgi:hypothetical protein
MVLLKRGKNNGIAVYDPKEIVLKEIGAKIEEVKPARNSLIAPHKTQAN